MIIKKGTVFKFGDNIDTDQIYPGRYLELTEHYNIANHAMEGIDSQFSSKVNDGDIIVAGKNFGCGSSREHAVICLKETGIRTIIANSFARIFYRNAINMGMPLVELSNANKKFEEGDIISVNIKEGYIEKKDGERYTFKPLPDYILNIIKLGAIINFYRK